MPQALVDALGGEAFATLTSWLPLSPEKIRRELATGIVGNFPMMQQLLGEAERGELEAWGISLRKKSLVQLAGLGTNEGQQFGFKVTCSPREIKDENDMAMFATVLALATSGPAQALIAAGGYELRFIRERKKPAALPTPEPTEPEA